MNGLHGGDVFAKHLTVTHPEIGMRQAIPQPLGFVGVVDHPDQGGWSKSDLAVRVNEEWFDEKGFFVCEDKGKLIGFCWTKIHGAHTHSHEGNEADHGHEAIGEIYVLAVDPAYKGQGIGKDLTTTGLNYLKYQGLSSAMLYVGVENKAALNLYKSLGFSDFGSDVMYRVKS